jgi:hypothetical protein
MTSVPTVVAIAEPVVTDQDLAGCAGLALGPTVWRGDCG